MSAREHVGRSRTTEYPKKELSNCTQNKKSPRTMRILFLLSTLMTLALGPNRDISLALYQDQSEIVTRSVVDHSAWDALLQKYVNDRGEVDYASLGKERQKLDAYLEAIAGHPPQNNWSRAEKMAYWINAYNAFTVQLILDNYPLKSIRDLDQGNVWDRQWIVIGDNTYSLNNLEHDILRKQYTDARIHFAVNCAARSCPPLLNRAWTAANLRTTLDQQTRAFINNQTYNTITQQSVQISKIFDWYRKDFGDLIAFLNQYARTKIQPNAKVSFQTYDWALNAQK